MAKTDRPQYDPFSAVREMLNTDKINSKTDLDMGQIKNISEARTLTFIFDSKLGNRHLTDFMVTTLSRERRSRGEVLESVKTTVANMVEDLKFKLTG